MYVLGIDGGGTKTTGVVTNLQGNVLIAGTVGPTNPISVGYEKVEQELQKLLNLLKEINPNYFSQISYVFAGMSGAGRTEEQEKIASLLKKSLPPDSIVRVKHDALIALYAGTFGKPGIVNICGTGSITFGINQAGVQSRVGGWGYLFGDPGSGFSIGRSALKHVFAEYDGIGPETRLTPQILGALKVDSAPDILKLIYKHGESRQMIASLSKLVFEAARSGDTVANSIIQKAGRDMANSIKGIFPKLFSNQEVKVPVVLTGGVYTQSEWFLPIIQNELNGFNIKIVLPPLPPVAGAVCAALKHGGYEVPASFTDNFLVSGGSDDRTNRA